METRTVTRTFALRASGGDEGSMVLNGRALTYLDVSSNELALGVREQIMPGCFRAYLASGQPTFCTLNHDMHGLPLARTDNGSLTIDDNAKCLNFSAQLDKNIAAHKDVWAAVRAGLIKECSFAFVVSDEDIQEGEYNGAACVVRCVREASLNDVSVVTEPFYGEGATAVAARAAAGKAEQDRKLRIARAALSVAEDSRKQRIDAAIRDGFQKTPDMEGVSAAGMEDWMAARLTKALAGYGRGWRYIAHTDSKVYALPLDALDDDPDMDEQECMHRSWALNYSLSPEGDVVLGRASRYSAEEFPEGPDVQVNARRVIAELRENAIWKRRMQATAGVFRR